MGGFMLNTISVDQAAEFGRSGKATEIADWVILLGLQAESHVLYMRLCRAAANEDRSGVRVTVSKGDVDEMSGGDGVKALKELLRVGAVTRIASYKSGKVRIQIEIYPPEVRAAMSEYRHEGGLPVVTYG